MRNCGDESHSTKGFQFVASFLAILAICQLGYAQQASNIQHANAFSQPKEIRSVSGVLNVTLNLAVAPTTIAGRALHASSLDLSAFDPSLGV